MPTQQQLDQESRRLVQVLKEFNLRIVFAESCTGGLVSATLTKWPGISAYHCGSAVVYQVETKMKWLGISSQILKKPGPVSRVVAAEMAKRILLMTPKADVAAAVTGHLGPDAPQAQDGLVYVAVAFRSKKTRTADPRVVVKRYWLDELEPVDSKSGKKLRHRRQLMAAQLVFATTVAQIEQHASRK